MCKRLACYAPPRCLLRACPRKPQLPEIRIPPDRIAQKGYSLIPPNEKGWLVAGRNDYQLALVKKGANPDETFAIQAVPFRLSEFNTNEEFIRLIKEGQAKDTDSRRFKIVKHDVVSYPKIGTNCAKSHTVSEDRAAVKRSQKPGDMILEAMALTCAHPKDKNLGISVIYSQRYYPGQRDLAFAEQATTVLSSVEFMDL